MDRILQKWRITLEDIFNYTYSLILSKEQIDERINYILNNINTINPEALYNCLLYSDTRYEIGKIAIDYRISFCLNNYKNVIDNGLSFEIDNLITTEKELIMRDIKGTKILFNFIMFKKINSDDEIDIENEIKQINNKFIFELHDVDENKLVPSDHILHLMTRNQFCYSAVFNRNPFSSENLQTNTISHIKSTHKIRCDIFEILKRKYINGIDDIYTTNERFFG